MTGQTDCAGSTERLENKEIHFLRDTYTALFFQPFIFNWKSKSRFSPDRIGPGEKKDFEYDSKINC